MSQPITMRKVFYNNKDTKYYYELSDKLAPFKDPMHLRYTNSILVSKDISKDGAKTFELHNIYPIEKLETFILRQNEEQRMWNEVWSDTQRVKLFFDIDIKSTSPIFEKYNSEKGKEALIRRYKRAIKAVLTSEPYHRNGQPIEVVDEDFVICESVRPKKDKISMHITLLHWAENIYEAKHFATLVKGALIDDLKDTLDLQPYHPWGSLRMLHCHKFGLKNPKKLWTDHEFKDTLVTYHDRPEDMRPRARWTPIPPQLNVEPLKDLTNNLEETHALLDQDPETFYDAISDLINILDDQWATDYSTWIGGINAIVNVCNKTAMAEDLAQEFSKDADNYDAKAVSKAVKYAIQSGKSRAGMGTLIYYATQSNAKEFAQLAKKYPTIFRFKDTSKVTLLGDISYGKMEYINEFEGRTFASIEDFHNEAVPKLANFAYCVVGGLKSFVTMRFIDEETKLPVFKKEPVKKWITEDGRNCLISQADKKPKPYNIFQAIEDKRLMVRATIYRPLPFGQEPVHNQDAVNRWPGFKAKPVAEINPQIIADFREVLCHAAGVQQDSVEEKYLLDYYSQMLQNPAEPTGKGLGFYSKLGGTGKSIINEHLFANGICGNQIAYHCQNLNSTLQHFNAHLSGKIFISVGEAVSPNMHVSDAVETFKSLVDAAEREVTAKGRDTTTETNYARYGICTNKDQFFIKFMADGGRKLSIFESDLSKAGSKPGNAPYWTKMAKSIYQGEGPNHIATWLFQRKIETDLAQNIQTNFSQGLHEQAKSPLDIWLSEFKELHAPKVLQHGKQTADSYQVNPQDALREFKNWCSINFSAKRGSTDIDVTRFSRAFKSAFPEIAQTKNAIRHQGERFRAYVFPLEWMPQVEEE